VALVGLAMIAVPTTTARGELGSARIEDVLFLAPRSMRMGPFILGLPRRALERSCQRIHGRWVQAPVLSCVQEGVPAGVAVRHEFEVPGLQTTAMRLIVHEPSGGELHRRLLAQVESFTRRPSESRTDADGLLRVTWRLNTEYHVELVHKTTGETRVTYRIGQPSLFP
jgi:hypothetical protein